MYLTRSEYDRGVNTFSPEGRLFQVGWFLLSYPEWHMTFRLPTGYPQFRDDLFIDLF